jgi:hypothetical protein
MTALTQLGGAVDYGKAGASYGSVLAAAVVTLHPAVGAIIRSPLPVDERGRFGPRPLLLRGCP